MFAQPSGRQTYPGFVNKYEIFVGECKLGQSFGTRALVGAARSRGLSRSRMRLILAMSVRLANHDMTGLRDTLAVMVETPKSQDAQYLPDSPAKDLAPVRWNKEEPFTKVHLAASEAGTLKQAASRRRQCFRVREQIPVDTAC